MPESVARETPDDSGVKLARLHVMVAAEHLSPTGGTGAHARSSVAALSGRAKVTAAVGADLAGEARDAHVVSGIGGKPATPEARTGLLRLIREISPDLIHVQQLPDGSLIEEMRRQAPVVFNVHNYVGCTSGWKFFRKPGQECSRSHGPGCIPNLAARGCAHTRDPRGLPLAYHRTTELLDGLRQADAVVAHSRFVAEHLQANGIERVTLVPLFLDPAPSPSPLPASGPVVYSGRVTPTKGVGTFLRAVAAVDTEAEVCGDGWWVPQARQLAERLGIADRVAFRGWLAPAELSDAYRRARLAVVPSHWPEPFGLVGLEAMAHGRPVVGAATGGIPEWLVDGVTGVLVEPGDARSLGREISALLSSPERSAQMGIEGAGRVARTFSRERYLAAIGQAYDGARRHWRAQR